MSNLGFKIDYCSVRMAEIKIKILIVKQIRGKEKINVVILTKCHAYI